ncbi:intracellular hyaluronan-binding protein 4 [Porphyrio hochstetteri]
MMKETADSPLAVVMQENFSCTIANRFYQLWGDESDPFDILSEAEKSKQHPKKRDEVPAAAGKRAGGKAGGGKRESQKERKQLRSNPAPREPSQSGEKQAPKRGEKQGLNDRGAEVEEDKTEWKTTFRGHRSYEKDRQVGSTVGRPVDRSSCERPVTGRGRGRGSGINQRFVGFDRRGRQEFERPSGNDKSGMEWTAATKGTAEAADQPQPSEGAPLTKAAEAQKMEVPQEMTLDEWKTLQQQNRPKPEFNIRKPESTVPSKAVVIHKPRYNKNVQKQYLEDDSPVFRRPVNDITFQLDINFGSLSRFGRGSRRARGGSGRGRQVEEKNPQPAVAVQLVAPNPDDPDDFPALA